MIKCYIILRSDLNISLPKMCVQGAHAMDIVWSIINEHPTDNVMEWVEKYCRRKIVLKISTLEKLENLEKYLTENKILAYKIIDNGLTEFNGKTTTGLVIPPFYSDEKLRSLPQFKRLQLL